MTMALIQLGGHQFLLRAQDRVWSNDRTQFQPSHSGSFLSKTQFFSEPARAAISEKRREQPGQKGIWTLAFQQS